MSGGITRDSNVPILKKNPDSLRVKFATGRPNIARILHLVDNHGSSNGNCHYYHYALDSSSRNLGCGSKPPSATGQTVARYLCPGGNRNRGFGRSVQSAGQ